MPNIHGSVIDKETRCTHYHSFRCYAIKFKCCDKYYPCYKCHDEHESHSIQRWTEKEFDKSYYVCANHEMSIHDYMMVEVS